MRSYYTRFLNKLGGMKIPRLVIKYQDKPEIRAIEEDAVRQLRALLEKIEVEGRGGGR